MIINNTSKVYGVYQMPSVTRTTRNSRAEEQMDMVAISNKAKDYQKVYSAIKRSPDVREDKIAELKAKFDSGAYNASGNDIAAKLLGI